MSEFKKTVITYLDIANIKAFRISYFFFLLHMAIMTGISIIFKAFSHYNEKTELHYNFSRFLLYWTNFNVTQRKRQLFLYIITDNIQKQLGLLIFIEPLCRHKLYRAHFIWCTPLLLICFVFNECLFFWCTYWENKNDRSNSDIGLLGFLSLYHIY